MPPKKRNAQGHQLAEKLPNGEVLRDLRKGEWKLGDVIGQGGFGLIYLASEKDSSNTGANAEYVVKIEPDTNGPLFCELAFYQRVAKPDIIDGWVKSKKLKYLGVPKYIARGSHQYKDGKYRFMVMQRFGSDLQSLFVGAGKRFDERSVYSLALRLIDALEFLHANGYVHADIKASNCLLGYHAGKVDTDKVYLVDFGLANLYASNNTHKVYKEVPTKAHDGTIEFTSMDAHKGVDPSRRGDMEILGYCLLQWLCGRLPWEDKLADKNCVAQSKFKYMADIPALMKKCFPGGDVPDVIEKYFKMVKKLSYSDEPNYNQMRDLFIKGLGSLGIKDTWKLSLPTRSAVTSPKKTVPKKLQAANGKNPKSPRPSTPKARAGTAKATPKARAGTPKATPKARAGTPKATPKARAGTPKATPKARAGTPKATPKARAGTLKATPKARAGTPKATPKARAGTPKAATTPKVKITTAAGKKAKASEPKVSASTTGRKRSASPTKPGTPSPVKKMKCDPRSPSAANAARVGQVALESIGDGPSTVNGGPSKLKVVAKRAKSPIAGGPVPKRSKAIRRKKVQLSEMAVQTSPGLKKNK